MKYFNERKIFSNLEDDRSTLEDGTAERFSNNRVEVIGTAALFRAVV